MAVVVNRRSSSSTARMMRTMMTMTMTMTMMTMMMMTMMTMRMSMIVRNHHRHHHRQESDDEAGGTTSGLWLRLLAASTAKSSWLLVLPKVHGCLYCQKFTAACTAKSSCPIGKSLALKNTFSCKDVPISQQILC
eukprot:3163842-Rhodomonas_salina.1